MEGNESIFDLYHKVHKELIKNIKRIAGPYEFKRGELPILAKLIKRGDGITQREMLDNLPISKSTMSKNIDNLVQKGYLRKEKDPEDRRATRIYLTDKGKRAEETIREIDSKVEKIMLEGLNESDKSKLKEYLKTILESLEK